MKKQLAKSKSIEFLLVFIIAAFFLLISAGCDRYTRHKILNVFFTGVPPLEGEIAVKKRTVVKQKKRRRKVRVEVAFIHGPKAAGECYHCHDTSSTMNFGRVGKKRKGSMPKGGEIMPGRLSISKKEICTQCHISKSPDLAYVGDMWLHGPVSNGDCIICHNYHQTRNRYMLTSSDTRKLCTQCHAERFMLESESHNNKDECISCHNAHIGKNRYLLKKDFDEIF